MFCTSCGKQNPDDANFCNNCGKPFRQDATHRNPDQYWETCEILCQDIHKPAGGVFGGPAIIRFAAHAIGRNGSFVAGYSDGFDYPRQSYYRAVRYDPPLFLPGPSESNVKNASDKLIHRLTSDGWEPTERGQAWFNHKFRRQARQQVDSS